MWVVKLGGSLARSPELVKWLGVFYKLRRKKYNDYRDEIDELIDDNPGQMSFDQYQYIYDTVSSKNGCNFLIFGLGKDSQLWIEANKNGNTE